MNNTYEVESCRHDLFVKLGVGHSMSMTSEGKAAKAWLKPPDEGSPSCRVRRERGFAERRCLDYRLRSSPIEALRGSQMAGSGEVYKRADGKFAFRVKASNGEVVATD